MQPSILSSMHADHLYACHAKASSTECVSVEHSYARPPTPAAVSVMFVGSSNTASAPESPKCGMTYRYQEWKDGLDNFNDHLILMLRFCLYLRHNLQVCASNVLWPKVIIVFSHVTECSPPCLGRVLLLVSVSLK